MRLEKQNKLNNIIDTSLKNLGQLIDAKTVIGNPIIDENKNIIIPVSKVTFGILSGGGEYGKLSLFKSGSDLPYSAGNTAIVSVKPNCFLVNDGNGYRLITTENNIDNIFDKTLSIFNKIKK